MKKSEDMCGIRRLRIEIRFSLEKKEEENQSNPLSLSLQFSATNISSSCSHPTQHTFGNFFSDY